MTVDELMALLESCHYAAEVRLAVPGRPPNEAAILGITSSQELSADSTEPGTAWILGGEIIGAIDAAKWNPAKRRQP
jgi:hypothetical protein